MEEERNKKLKNKQKKFKSFTVPGSKIEHNGTNASVLHKKHFKTIQDLKMANQYEIDNKSESKISKKKQKEKGELNCDLSEGDDVHTGRDSNNLRNFVVEQNKSDNLEYNVIEEQEIKQDAFQKQKKKKKKKKNKSSQLSGDMFQENENKISDTSHIEDSAESENKEKKVKLKSISGSFTVESISEEPKKKKKKIKTQTIEECEEEEITDHKSSVSDNGKTPNLTENEHNKSSSPSNKIGDEEYYPGMLSNFLQTKKYGHLIVPWDPSFGLDPDYKLPERHEGDPDLKINPLFDFSKRKIENFQSSEEAKEKSIFLGNLPSDMKIADIKKLFKKCGMIDHVKVKSGEYIPKRLQSQKKEAAEEKDSKPKNAVVRFQNMDSCKLALKLNGTLYKGHHIRVTLVHKEAPEADTRNRTVFVGNLSFKVQDEDLWKAFQGCGDIESVRAIRDNVTKQCKGFGYVNFKSAESVELALEREGTPVLGRNIRVRRTTPESKGQSDSASVQMWKKKKKKFSAKKSDNETICEMDNEEENVASKPVGKVMKIFRPMSKPNSPDRSNEEGEMSANIKKKKHKKKSKVNISHDDSHVQEDNATTVPKKPKKKKKKPKDDSPEPESG